MVHLQLQGWFPGRLGVPTCQSLAPPDSALRCLSSASFNLALSFETLRPTCPGRESELSHFSPFPAP
uniref:Uncharacterized protein n=1 Tax=Oryza rufipogon TaxID=4529 RepID=A0A0E0PPS0_ORYRU